MAARPDGGYCTVWRQRATVPPSDEIALLCQILAGLPRFTDGIPLCVGNARRFDADDNPDGWVLAIGMCARCPVLAQCEAYADSQPPGALSGVVAGRLYV